MISPILVRPARAILLVGLVAISSIACTNASAGSGAATPPPATPAPSATSPSAAPSAAAGLHLALLDELTSGATVDIVDGSGTLVGARAAGLAERAPNPGAPATGDVTVQNVDASTLWVSWTAGNCPDAHVLTIDAGGHDISISQPPFCGGDTIGVARRLVLSFGGPIAAADVTARLVAVEASPTP